MDVCICALSVGASPYLEYIADLQQHGLHRCSTLPIRIPTPTATASATIYPSRHVYWFGPRFSPAASYSLLNSHHRLRQLLVQAALLLLAELMRLEDDGE